MRTTLDIDEDVLETAKELAPMQRVSVGKVISELARRSLRQTTESTGIRNGVPLLSPRQGAQVVTMEVVNRLRDDIVSFPATYGFGERGTEAVTLRFQSLTGGDLNSLIMSASSATNCRPRAHPLSTII